MPPETRHLTILLTDIKGFTDKTSAGTRADIQRLLDDHRETVLPVLQGRGGRLVKTIGDAFLMVFDSPTNAVLAGVGAQDALAKRNAGLPEAERIEIRVAINAGEVNLVEGDVFGEPVNITARIEGVAEAGEVYFTEAVYLAMNKAEVPSAEVGLLQLKGIPEKIRVYKVRRETPLGVGQLPSKTPPAAASGFAPGEKARVVPAGPAERAATDAQAAPLSRRATALALDGLVCSLLAGMLLGGDSAAVGVRVDPQTRTASAEAGVTASVPGVGTLTADEAGMKFKDDEGRETVVGEGDGWRATVGRRRRGRGFFPLAWFAYNFLFVWTLSGATPGKKLLGLRVVAEDGTPLDGRRAGIRAMMSLVSGSVLMLGYAWPFGSSTRRTWHDSVAGSRVVRAG
ncbi:MAG: RDD family protein [Elusimicrobiota bacterium]|nr:RDD family protein [Elusimicrobiota bacterium]